MIECRWKYPAAVTDSVLRCSFDFSQCRQRKVCRVTSVLAVSGIKRAHTIRLSWCSAGRKLLRHLLVTRNPKAISQVAASPPSNCRHCASWHASTNRSLQQIPNWLLRQPACSVRSLLQSQVSERRSSHRRGSCLLKLGVPKNFSKYNLSSLMPRVGKPSLLKSLRQVYGRATAMNAAFFKPCKTRRFQSEAEC